jgi:O-antigen/teichoic acid export membrane protein
MSPLNGSSGPELAPRDLTRRALAGTVLLGGRGAVVRVAAFVGNVLLARLLTPSQFGAVAFGLTVVTFATLMTDGGLGAGLIRRAEAPERHDLRAVLGGQLLVSFGVAGAIAAIGVSLGRVGAITAVMMPALPLLALRTPSMIVLERGLHFRPVIAVEIAEVIAYYAWALTAITLGWGVWGLASASVAKAFAGTAILFRVAPTTVVFPSLSWARLRNLIGFGARYQATKAVSVAREQALNAGTLAMAGTATLGFWALAVRVMQGPFLLFESLWRVSYPAMAQLVSGGHDPGPVIARVLRLAALATGVGTVVLVGSSPALVTSIFGARWAPASGAVALAALGLQISGPISSATVGFLYGVGNARIVLWSTTLYSVAWLGVGLTLLPLVGVAALGAGWLAASIVEAVVLARATATLASVRFVDALALPCLAAFAASAAGWALCTSLPRSLISGLLCGSIALALYLLCLFVLRRDDLVQTLQLIRRAAGLAMSSAEESQVPDGTASEPAVTR